MSVEMYNPMSQKNNYWNTFYIQLLKPLYLRSFEPIHRQQNSLFRFVSIKLELTSNAGGGSPH